MIKCDECGNWFSAGMTEEGFPNGVGFQMADGSVHNVCNECLMTFEQKIQPRSNKKGKAEMFALNIPQSEYDKMFDDKIIEIVKKCNGFVLAESKNPLLYIATFLFKDKSDRKKCSEKLTKKGVRNIIDKTPALVDRKWLP